MASTDLACKGCKYAINPQGYFHKCNNPARLESLKRFYYVDRYPVKGCYNNPKAKS